MSDFPGDEAARPPAVARARKLADLRRRPLLHIGRASNGTVLIRDEDRVYGTLLIGGQGAGKTSVMLRMYLNDIGDPNACPIVVDPKSELSRLALAMTPPDCGKRVWFLDLGRPRFGMTPVRMYGDQPFASEAASIADGVVESLLDINAGQIMQASRDLLYRATIGALALAKLENRTANFEDIYALLLPGQEEARELVVGACARIPDLDQTAEFFRKELPDDLKLSTSSTADRLRAPRNKVAGIVGVPPLRRFLNHPTDLPLREIVENRDILIIDANMAAVGEANAQAIMHFVFRQLHHQMQRQVRQQQTERARVALLCDEFHYLASRNVIKQIATHRAAGLDVTAGLQFFSQLGAGADSASVTEEIRQGVLNLLQSRCLFRLGDPDDAEQASRIAMAVYQSMIRSDPDSRAQMRVTPESILNLPRFHCLASWIVDGQRTSSFVMQTEAMNHQLPTTWADLHLEAQNRRVGPYPEHMAATLRISYKEPVPPRAQQDGPPRPVSPGNGLTHTATPREEGTIAGSATPLVAAGADHATVEQMLAAHQDKTGPSIQAAAAVPQPQKSRVRAVVGNPDRGQETLFETAGESTEQLPEALRALAFIDRVNELGQALDVAQTPAAVGRIYKQDLAILQLLDRAGTCLPWLIQHVVMPNRSESQVRKVISKLYNKGLIGRRSIGIREQREYRGSLPSAIELTRLGFKLAQERGAIHESRTYRAAENVRGLHVPHDHHALAWFAQFDRVGGVTTTMWRTPRYATGRFPVPQTGSGHRRRPLAVTDIDLAPPQALFDLLSTDFGEVKPDITAEARVPSLKLTFDVMVEYQHASNPDNYREKFRHYDSFLTGWCLAHRRYRTVDTRPIVVVVAADPKDLLTLAKRADEVMKGAVGVQGTPPATWYYAGRDHIFFALEQDVYRERLRALSLPQMPPNLREGLGEAGLQLSPVSLLPSSMIEAAKRKAGTASDDE
jgi:hypothetical protein